MTKFSRSKSGLWKNSLKSRSRGETNLWSPQASPPGVPFVNLSHLSECCDWAGGYFPAIWVPLWIQRMSVKWNPCWCKRAPLFCTMHCSTYYIHQPKAVYFCFSVLEWVSVAQVRVDSLWLNCDDPDYIQMSFCQIGNFPLNFLSSSPPAIARPKNTPASVSMSTSQTPDAAGQNAPALGLTKHYVSILMETETAAVSFWMKCSATGWI